MNWNAWCIEQRQMRAKKQGRIKAMRRGAAKKIQEKAAAAVKPVFEPA